MLPEDQSQSVAQGVEPRKYRGLYDIGFDLGYLEGLRRAIVIRLQSRFGRMGMGMIPWLNELKMPAEHEAFLEAIDTVDALRDLYEFLPPDDGSPPKYR